MSAERPLHPRAARVQDTFRELGLAVEVVQLPASSHTAEDAAAAVGAEVGRIAKSLVFLAGNGRVVLAVASGAHRVDESRLAAEAGVRLSRPDARTVKERTGYPIGGVPPVGYEEQPLTVVDAALLRYPTIWVAAGTPNAVAEVEPHDLVGATDARVAELAASPGEP